MEGSYGWGGLREEGIMKTSVYRAWGIRVSRAKGGLGFGDYKNKCLRGVCFRGGGFYAIIGI